MQIDGGGTGANPATFFGPNCRGTNAQSVLTIGAPAGYPDESDGPRQTHAQRIGRRSLPGACRTNGVSGLNQQNLSKFAYTVLGYSVLVILFGAFVRASYSGDGCGASWPMCGETFVPEITSAPRAVELTHRLTSGLLALLCASLWGFSSLVLPKGSAARRAAGFALLSCIISALVGAILVKFQWVTNDKSYGRAVTMPIHLVNNYFLLASLSCTAFWAGGGKVRPFQKQGALTSALNWAFGAMFLLGATGAFSALGKTAFEHELAPVKGFAERLWLHVGPEANPILRGGVVHPLIATSVGLLIFWVCGVISHLRPSPQVKSMARWTAGLYLAQMVVGVTNLVVSAPTTMQLIHLALAIANWVSLVMLALRALASDVVNEDVETTNEPHLPTTPAAAHFEEEGGRATFRDYIALTKPRVISLLLFTTVAAMFVAQRGVPALWLILLVCIGGYAAAGAANTFNMVMESDLDQSMERTSHRPTVTNKVSKKQALIFAWSLAIGSFVLLWVSANLLSAVMALCGLLCYVFVYTLWLKRRTWNNIVIGGAAGAFPPLVGYAAVAGTLSPLAWFLFAIIFLWTPVHFWALALLIKDDYAKAGVPMLPVVKGDRVTVNQIGIYTALTALVSAMPFLQGQAGMIYLIGSVLLNLGLIVQSVKLWQHTERPQAKALFKYSMVYLALFFIVIAVDQARWS